MHQFLGSIINLSIDLSNTGFIGKKQESNTFLHQEKKNKLKNVLFIKPPTIHSH